MRYHMRVGVIQTFAQKNKKLLSLAVAGLFAASIAAMSISASAAVQNVNGCSFEDGTPGVWSLLSDCTTSAQINIPADTTVEGNGFTVSAGFAKTTNSNNSVLGVIGVDNVSIQNMTIDGSGGTDLHLINTYLASNVSVTNVMLVDSNRSGIVVNGSDVTVDGVSTSGSGWHGINVSQGSGVTEASVLNIPGLTDQSGDFVDIYVDDISDDFEVNDTLGQYAVTNPGFAGRNDQLYTWSDITPPGEVDGMTILVSGNDLGCYPVINTRNITVDWNDSTADDLAYYQYQADADKVAPFDFTTTVNSSQRSGTIRDEDGTYNYRVRAVDTSGNMGEWSEWCGVTLDREAPVVDITSHENGDVVSATQVLEATIEDDNNARHRLLIRNSDNDVVYSEIVRNTDEPAYASFTLDTTLLEDGVYRLVVVGIDEAGNRGRDAVRVEVDNRPDNKEECKNGGWVLGLDLNTTFRNQGDCVSYFATGERNPATNGASDERANSSRSNNGRRR